MKSWPTQTLHTPDMCMFLHCVHSVRAASSWILMDERLKSWPITNIAHTRHMHAPALCPLCQGCILMGQDEWDCARILAGRPAVGAELTEDFNPLEAGLCQAVSVDKVQMEAMQDNFVPDGLHCAVQPCRLLELGLMSFLLPECVIDIFSMCSAQVIRLTRQPLGRIPNQLLTLCVCLFEVKHMQ